jgi:hypothetical protein
MVLPQVLSLLHLRWPKLYQPELAIDQMPASQIIGREE